MASPSGPASAAGIGVPMRSPWLNSRTVPLKAVGIWILKEVVPRDPVRLPSQVVAMAQASAALAGAIVGAATSSSPAGRDSPQRRGG